MVGRDPAILTVEACTIRAVKLLFLSAFST